jgi:ABC-type multidrug transport system ATPase subunit
MSQLLDKALREVPEQGKRYSDLLRGLARTVATPPHYHGEPARVIPLKDGSLSLGNAPDNDLVLSAETIALHHAVVEPWPEGYAVHDAGSKTGTFVNGRGIKWSGLRPGDLIQLGPYLFQFKKTFLVWLRQPAALTLAAVGLRHQVGELTLLDQVNLVARPGEFVGLLGPSGAGKTTLLNALCGLVPAQQGQVLLNGAALYEQSGRWRRIIGYVPQEDIVHVELTPRQAFRYAARLRLPDATPDEERAAQVDKTLMLLELNERADVPIQRLSGGQRKRVSVGVELIGRPRMLFLDEPTSGLDPSTEAKLMRTLSELAHQGRTVLCTTHIMENVELFDRIAVLAPGGKLAYFGPPDEVQEYFEVERFSQIYDRLEEKSPESWRLGFQSSPQAWPLKQDLASERQPQPFHRSDTQEGGDPPGDLVQWTTLTRRFAQCLLSGKTPYLLVAQPVLLGSLIALVFAETRPILFLLIVATLWFGCSLGAQQIVKERAILRRERRVFLDWMPYLASKFLLLVALTTGQAMLMWSLIGYFRELPGDLMWQMLSLAAAAANGVAFGLLISSFAANSDSATGSVPLAMMPQIVLAGILLPLPEMNHPTKMIAQAVPSRWCYQTMEASWLEGRRVTDALLREKESVAALANLYPDDDFNAATGRKKFLDEHRNAALSFGGVAAQALGVLALLCALQLLALTGILAARE